MFKSIDINLLLETILGVVELKLL